jgi:hypothetical protein
MPEGSRRDARPAPATFPGVGGGGGGGQRQSKDGKTKIERETARGSRGRQRLEEVTVVGGQFGTASLAATLWKPMDAPIMQPTSTTYQSSRFFELEIWGSCRARIWFSEWRRVEGRHEIQGLTEVKSMF